jgi:hypothetical protein
VNLSHTRGRDRIGRPFVRIRPIGGETKEQWGR